MKTFDKMPQGIDLILTDLPFIYQENGREYLVSENPSLDTKTDVDSMIDCFNSQADTLSTELHTILYTIDAVIDGKELKKPQLYDHLNKLSDMIKKAIDQIPYAEL